MNQVHAWARSRTGIVNGRCQTQRRIKVMAGVNLFGGDYRLSRLDINGDVRDTCHWLQPKALRGSIEKLTDARQELAWTEEAR